MILFLPNGPLTGIIHPIDEKIKTESEKWTMADDEITSYYQMTRCYQMTTDYQVLADNKKNWRKWFDQTASFFSIPFSDSSPEEEICMTIIVVISLIIIITLMIIIIIITWGSDLLSDHGQVFLPLRQGLWIRWSPAECVEHVEEGDGDVDEDDQRVERVRDQLVRTLLVSWWRAGTCLLLNIGININNVTSWSENERSLLSLSSPSSSSSSS